MIQLAVSIVALAMSIVALAVSIPTLIVARRGALEAEADLARYRERRDREAAARGQREVASLELRQAARGTTTRGPRTFEELEQGRKNFYECTEQRAATTAQGESFDKYWYEPHKKRLEAERELRTKQRGDA